MRNGKYHHLRYPMYLLVPEDEHHPHVVFTNIKLNTLNAEPERALECLSWLKENTTGQYLDNYQKTRDLYSKPVFEVAHSVVYFAVAFSDVQDAMRFKLTFGEGNGA